MSASCFRKPLDFDKPQFKNLPFLEVALNDYSERLNELTENALSSDLFGLPKSDVPNEHKRVCQTLNLVHY